MCEIGAACPNCHQPDLDADERSCRTFADMSERYYLCHVCGAHIAVSIPHPPLNRAPHPG